MVDPIIGIGLGIYTLAELFSHLGISTIQNKAVDTYYGLREQRAVENNPTSPNKDTGSIFLSYEELEPFYDEIISKLSISKYFPPTARYRGNNIRNAFMEIKEEHRKKEQDN